MVSLLIVSHSAQLAAGVREFAEQVAGGKVQIADAGGAADGSLAGFVLTGFVPAPGFAGLAVIGGVFAARRRRS